MGAIDRLYNHDFAISRPSRTGDGQGGWPVGYADAGSIRGRLRPKDASEQTVASQGQAKVTHVLYCAATVDVRKGDLVSGAGVTVEVIAVRDPSNMGHHYEIDCGEVQKEGEESGS